MIEIKSIMDEKSPSDYQDKERDEKNRSPSPTPTSTPAAAAKTRNPHEIIHRPPPDLSHFNHFFGSPPVVVQVKLEDLEESEDKIHTKKMTAGQMARWEEEQERLAVIAKETERLRLEQEEREWNAPLIPRLTFDERPRIKMPSISPRDRLSYQSDKKCVKEIERFHDKNPSLFKFFVMLHTQILTDKPENILDYIAEEYLHESNEPNLRSEFLRQESRIREFS